MDTHSLYPYVVPKEYLFNQNPPVKSLGHDTYEVLVTEAKSLIKNVTAQDLQSLGLTAGQAQRLALENLENVFKAGAIKAQLLPRGPMGKPFIIVGGHWAAAAVPLLPRFPDFAARTLGVAEVFLSIPHQGIVMVFPKGDETYGREVRVFVKQNEGRDRKPITFGLFTYRGTDLVPVAGD